jgi:hypothetical protein
MSDLKKDAAYDEIGGEMRPGCLIRVQEFKPAFFLVRAGKIERTPDGKAFMEIFAEPMKIPVELGKMHTGLVRVVDPASDTLLEGMQERAGILADELHKRREVVKIDEHGKRIEAT